jgi:hypothetical protein
MSDVVYSVTAEHMDACQHCAATMSNNVENGDPNMSCVSCEGPAHPCHDKCGPCKLCKAPFGQHQSWCWKTSYNQTMPSDHMHQLRTRYQCMRCERVKDEPNGCNDDNCVCTACDKILQPGAPHEESHDEHCRKKVLTVASRRIDPCMAAHIRHRTSAILPKIGAHLAMIGFTPTHVCTMMQSASAWAGHVRKVIADEKDYRQYVMSARTCNEEPFRGDTSESPENSHDTHVHRSGKIADVVTNYACETAHDVSSSRKANVNTSSMKPLSMQPPQVVTYDNALAAVGLAVHKRKLDASAGEYQELTWPHTPSTSSDTDTHTPRQPLSATVCNTIDALSLHTPTRMYRYTADLLCDRTPVPPESSLEQKANTDARPAPCKHVGNCRRVCKAGVNPSDGKPYKLCEECFGRDPSTQVRTTWCRACSEYTERGSLGVSPDEPVQQRFQDRKRADRLKRVKRSNVVRSIHSMLTESAEDQSTDKEHSSRLSREGDFNLGETQESQEETIERADSPVASCGMLSADPNEASPTIDGANSQRTPLSQCSYNIFNIESKSQRVPRNSESPVREGTPRVRFGDPWPDAPYTTSPAANVPNTSNTAGLGGKDTRITSLTHTSADVSREGGNTGTSHTIAQTKCLTSLTEANQSTTLTRTSPSLTPEDHKRDRLDEIVPRADRNSDRASRRSPHGVDKSTAKATANATGESQPIHINSVANPADILHARQYILDHSWPIVSRYMQQMPTIGAAYEPRDWYEQHATEEDRLRMVSACIQRAQTEQAVLETDTQADREDDLYSKCAQAYDAWHDAGCKVAAKCLQWINSLQVGDSGE